MTFKETKINERLTVMSARSDKFKTDTFSLTLALPRSAGGQADIALLSSVLLRGTEKYPSAKLLDRRLDELYASDIDMKFLRFGNVETLNICCEYLGSRYTENGEGLTCDMISMINELLFCPLTDGGGFRGDIVEREKRNVIDGIRSVINHPDSYAGARCLELMKRNDPDFVTLEEAAARVESHDGASLYKFFEDFKKSASVRVFYIGRTDGDIIEKKVAEAFGAKFAGEPLPFSFAKADVPAPTLEKTERMTLTQGKLVIGARTGVTVTDADFNSAVIFNEILGASPASKFFTNVREKQGLCYYCDSSLNIYTGNLLISSGIAPENRQRATEAIFREIEAMKNGKISISELEVAKKSTVNYYRQIFDRIPELFTFHTGRRLNGISAGIADCAEGFARVTKESVVRIANNCAADTFYFLEGGVI